MALACCMHESCDAVIVAGIDVCACLQEDVDDVHMAVPRGTGQWGGGVPTMLPSGSAPALSSALTNDQ